MKNRSISCVTSKILVDIHGGEKPVYNYRSLGPYLVLSLNTEHLCHRFNMHWIFQEYKYYVNGKEIVLYSAGNITRSYSSFLENHSSNGNAHRGVWVPDATPGCQAVWDWGPPGDPACGDEALILRYVFQSSQTRAFTYWNTYFIINDLHFTFLLQLGHYIDLFSNDVSRYVILSMNFISRL